MIFKGKTTQGWEQTFKFQCVPNNSSWSEGKCQVFEPALVLKAHHPQEQTCDPSHETMRPLPQVLTNTKQTLLCIKYAKVQKVKTFGVIIDAKGFKGINWTNENKFKNLKHLGQDSNNPKEPPSLLPSSIAIFFVSPTPSLLMLKKSTSKAQKKQPRRN